MGVYVCVLYGLHMFRIGKMNSIRRHRKMNQKTMYENVSFLFEHGSAVKLPIVFFPPQKNNICRIYWCTLSTVFAYNLCLTVYRARYAHFNKQINIYNNNRILLFFCFHCPYHLEGSTIYCYYHSNSPELLSFNNCAKCECACVYVRAREDLYI